MKKLLSFTISFLLIITLSLSANVTGNKSNDVILQGFHWNCWESKDNWYDIIINNAGRIKESGITAVWFPPASQSTSWAPWGYEPDQLYNLDSAYGTKVELKDAIKALHDRNIDAIADIVINHRHAEGTTFTNPSWPAEYICSNAETPGKGKIDTGDHAGFAEDLDHTNPKLQDAIVEFMNDHLAAVGFDGWRYDMVKGYSAEYTKVYNNKTKPKYSIGENFDWTASNIEDWIDKSDSPAFDFSLRNVLMEAVNNGHYSWLSDGNGGISGYTLIGTHSDRSNYTNDINYYKNRAVTFLDNHDTEEARGREYAQPFPNGDKSLIGYAFILTHPGIPCIYWSDIYDRDKSTENTINELVNIRKEYGINSGSNVNVEKAEDSKYYADYIHGDKGTLALKIGPENWSPSDSNFKLLVSGKDYAVWGNKTNI